MRSKLTRFDQFNAPGSIRVVEEEVPPPGPGEALVRVEAVSLTRPDVFYCNGFWPTMPLPATSGWSGSGVVEAVGPGVTGVAAGQAVTLSLILTSPEDESRGFARQWTVVPADRLVPIPDGVDVRDGAFAGFYASAWSVLHQGTDTPPRSLLQLGAAGNYGSAFVQVAHALGSLVIGTASSPERADFCRSLGADHVINHRTEHVVDRVLEITDGRGVEMIVDHIAGPGVSDYLRALAPWGTLMMVNTEAGEAGVDLMFPMQYSGQFPAVRYFASVGYAERPDGLMAAVARALELMRDHDLHPPIAATYPLAEINEAIAVVDQSPMGRVLLLPHA